MRPRLLDIWRGRFLMDWFAFALSAVPWVLSVIVRLTRGDNYTSPNGNAVCVSMVFQLVCLTLFAARFGTEGKGSRLAISFAAASIAAFWIFAMLGVLM
jgi:hypothetical protein